MSSTIFALSSGTGPAGIAVIRASGPGVESICQTLNLGNLQPRRAHLVRPIDPLSREPIDTAVALRFPRPHSYTGEDMLELHVHGGRAVVAAMLAALSRIASKGVMIRD